MIKHLRNVTDTGRRFLPESPADVFISLPPPPTPHPPLPVGSGPGRYPLGSTHCAHLHLPRAAEEKLWHSHHLLSRQPVVLQDIRQAGESTGKEEEEKGGSFGTPALLIAD